MKGMERMKLIEKYNITKNNNRDSIVFVESGVFFYTFDDDACIINYLFSYQIKDNSLGFPKTALEKVIYELEKRHINYVLNGEEKNYKDNQYLNMLHNSKKEYLLNSDIDLLIANIKFKIQEDNKNLNKIRSFIDEL